MDMKTYRVLWAVLVSATLALPGARAASAQTLNAPPAQAPGGPIAEPKGFIVGIGADGGLHRLPERGIAGDSFDRSAACGMLLLSADARAQRADVIDEQKDASRVSSAAPIGTADRGRLNISVAEWPSSG